MPKARTKHSQTPEVLDDATLAAIDKAERWHPGVKSVTMAQAMKNARIRYSAWKKAIKPQG